jgi:uncharacterized protein with beta-barrel porin domain
MHKVAKVTTIVAKVTTKVAKVNAIKVAKVATKVAKVNAKGLIPWTSGVTVSVTFTWKIGVTPLSR